MTPGVGRGCVEPTIGGGGKCRVAWRASSRVKPLPQDHHSLEGCGTPVGAGLPANRLNWHVQNSAHPTE
ncbi:hypothetical protein E8E78_13015 [Pseudomonas sp. BN505]|nr:hypothetical protein [Pseudomonas sp. BN605]MDH4857507.1 hypothetical protein [Pseudomonas sp. BN505]NTY93768.1 hypothetical protein [Pseudomonas putida]NTZ02326.1 hypothetical protein [Pseudomonas putida]NTZ23053.1 hypothetical protein [Pseudomonas putida]